MLSFSMLSLAIMLVTVVVMYIKFADASQDSIIESNHKVMDQTIDSVESYLVNMRQVYTLFFSYSVLYLDGETPYFLLKT